jgi:hypothetical protein
LESRHGRLRPTPIMRAPSLRTLGLFFTSAVLAAGLAGGNAEAKPAKHRPKKPRTSQVDNWGGAPSVRYAQLGRSECTGELTRRKIRFETVERARGVAIPIRPRGPIGGVLYRTELPASERADSPFEVMDCRLALALDDFSTILTKHGIEEVHMFSAWRPPPKSWPADKAAVRHPGGLAIDIRRFMKRAAAGSKPKDLVIDRDWTPQRDQSPCSKPSESSTDDDEKELRAIFCEADAERIFTSQLSPNYDGAHKNHFHMELRPGVKWRLVL